MSANYGGQAGTAPGSINMQPGGQMMGGQPPALPGHGRAGAGTAPGSINLPPPGVNPQSWAHPAWRSLWLKQHPEYQGGGMGFQQGVPVVGAPPAGGYTR